MKIELKMERERGRKAGREGGREGPSSYLDTIRVPQSGRRCVPFVQGVLRPLKCRGKDWVAEREGGREGGGRFWFFLP